MTGLIIGIDIGSKGTITFLTRDSDLLDEVVDIPASLATARGGTRASPRPCWRISSSRRTLPWPSSNSSAGGQGKALQGPPPSAAPVA